MAIDTPDPWDSMAPARKRRGFPVLPTLMMVVALPLLLGLGVWQLQRAQWKEALLEDLARNADAPMVVLTDRVLPPGLDFRQVRIRLECADAAPQPRAGRNEQGQSGYAVTFLCRGHGATILLNAGWGPRANSWTNGGGFPPAGRFAVEGVLVPMPEADLADWALVANAAPPPLVPSAAPGIETIPNNHRAYAIQWFSFAAILAVIYGLWLRRWLASRRRAP